MNSTCSNSQSAVPPTASSRIITDETNATPDHSPDSLPAQEEEAAIHIQSHLPREEGDNDDDDDDDDILSPEELLLVAVASSAMRSSHVNGRTAGSSTIATSIIADQPTEAENVVTHGRVDLSEISKLEEGRTTTTTTLEVTGIVRTKSKSSSVPPNNYTNNNNIVGGCRRHSENSKSPPPSPTSLLVRDRRVSVPGAFRLRGHTRNVEEEEEDYEVGNMDEHRGRNLNLCISIDEDLEEDDPAIIGKPVLEATLVPSHLYPFEVDGELVQGELIESPEIQKVNHRKKRKEWLCRGIVAGAFLVVVALIVMVAVFVLVFKEKNLIVEVEGKNVEGKNESESLDPVEGKNESDSIDPVVVLKDFDRITHHVAYVGWQSPRLCNFLDDEPIVHVECGGGEDDEVDAATIYVWPEHLLFESCMASGAHPKNEFECSNLFPAPSSSANTNTIDPITNVGRIVFSCGTRSSDYTSSSSRRTARAFVEIQEGACQYGDVNSDITNITIALAMSRICLSTDGSVIAASASSSSCHNAFSDSPTELPETLSVAFPNDVHAVACRRQTESCTAATTLDSCLFPALQGLSVEDHSNDADYCPSPSLLPDASVLDGMLASASEVQAQFFGSDAQYEEGS